MDKLAIKAIVVMGVFAFVFLGLTSIALRRSLDRSEPAPVQVGRAKSSFDGAQAYTCAAKIASLCRATPGEKGHEALRAFIRRELGRVGLETRRQVFKASTPQGEAALENLVGVVRGDSSGIIIVSGHYGCQCGVDPMSARARAGASTTAWLLEMARALGPTREGRSVWLCFLDGEEPQAGVSAAEDRSGCRAFVDHLEQRGELKRVTAVMDLNIVGRSTLGLNKDPEAPHWLTGIVWSRADELGYGRHFLPLAHGLEGECEAFREAHIPSAAIVESDVADEEGRGGDEAALSGAASPEGLQVVGDVIYHSILDIDAKLNASEIHGAAT